MRSGTPFEEEEDVCPSSTTSTVLKICDGFGNILSGIPSTKTFDAALFILGVDKTPLGTQNASLLSSSGAVVPDRDANGTDTRRGKFHRRPPRLRRQNHRRQGENAEKGKKKKEKTHFRRRRLQSIPLISLCISLSRARKKLLR
jgi:hypothetical protein